MRKIVVFALGNKLGRRSEATGYSLIVYRVATGSSSRFGESEIADSDALQMAETAVLVSQSSTLHGF